MIYVAICSSAATIAAGFLASLLPGMGIGPLWNARLQLSEANGIREHVSALKGVILTVLLMTIAGTFRLGTFALGAAMICTESLIEKRQPRPITDHEHKNGTQGEITNG